RAPARRRPRRQAARRRAPRWCPAPRPAAPASRARGPAATGPARRTRPPPAAPGSTRPRTRSRASSQAHAPVSYFADRRGRLEACMSDSLKTLLIIGFLGLILWNLGAGLYYMLVDKGTTKRTVNALTRRIALSVLLILLVLLAIWMGWITPHGIHG